MATINYTSAPNDLGGSFQRYIERGIPTGGFLQAVLENNMSEAFGRADSYNRACMFEIVAWLWNEATSDCWGSPEKVDAWLARFKKPRIYNESELERIARHMGVDSLDQDDGVVTSRGEVVAQDVIDEALS